MTDLLKINNKELLSIREAARSVSYSRDYITRLARDKKISATWIGRKWFIDLDSLKNFEESSLLENKIRKQKLSEERKSESNLHSVLKEREELNLNKNRSSHVRSLGVVVATLVFGLFIGAGFIHGNFSVGLLNDNENQAGVLFSSESSSDEGKVKTNFSEVLEMEEGLGQKVFIPVFSREIEKLPFSETGIVIAAQPDLYSSTTPEQLFSDEVFVRIDSSGSKELVWERKNNDIVQEESISFVAVPLRNEVIN